jgi:hypothetical protein
LAKAISGGQKRKLCLGISLIGRAKVMFSFKVHKIVYFSSFLCKICFRLFFLMSRPGKNQSAF